jgi:hypothetical protein
LSLFVSLTGNRLGLFVNHLPRNKAVLKGRVAVRKTTTLLLLLLSGRRALRAASISISKDLVINLSETQAVN